MGIDFSLKKWKKKQWQRSDDFFKNFVRIIDRSCVDDIDFLLIAGDIYDRSQPNPVITREMLLQLERVSRFKPVVIIPGNHDRSKLNIGLLYLNKNIHLINKPKNLILKIKGKNVLITGIPFIGSKITKYLTEEKSTFNFTEFYLKKIHFKILMLHELVESSIFGIQNFEFKKSMNGVIPLKLIPDFYDYVALGHVHTYQRIKRKLNIVYYSGSIERTSVVERNEKKGYIITEANFQDDHCLKNIGTKFCILPTRPLMFYKLNNISEFIIQEFETEFNVIKKKNKLAPLVILRIKDWVDYQVYFSIKLYLTNLKINQQIKSFSIFSEVFRKKGTEKDKVLIDAL